jgi:hypothetical protein
MKTEIRIQERQTLYHFLKADFKSAYNANNHNKELAISQVANFRGVSKELVESILSTFLKALDKKIRL